MHESERFRVETYCDNYLASNKRSVWWNAFAKRFSPLLKSRREYKPCAQAVRVLSMWSLFPRKITALSGWVGCWGAEILQSKLNGPWKLLVPSFLPRGAHIYFTYFRYPVLIHLKCFYPLRQNPSIHTCLCGPCMCTFLRLISAPGNLKGFMTSYR